MGIVNIPSLGEKVLPSAPSVEILSSVSSTTSAPSSATDGISASGVKREYAVLELEKTASATVMLWGYDPDANGGSGAWFALQQISKTNSYNEAEFLRAISYFDRLYLQVTGYTSGTVSARIIF